MQTYSVPPPLLPPRSRRASQRATKQAKAPPTSQRATKQATSRQAREPPSEQISWQQAKMPPTSPRAAEQTNEPSNKPTSQQANKPADQQQGVVTAPHRAGITSLLEAPSIERCRALFGRQTGPFPTSLPFFLEVSTTTSLPVNSDPKPSIARGPEIDRLAWQKLVAIVVCCRKVRKARNVSCLYRRLASVRHMTGMDDIAMGNALCGVRSPRSLPLGHPYTEDCTEGTYKTLHGRTTSTTCA